MITTLFSLSQQLNDLAQYSLSLVKGDSKSSSQFQAVGEESGSPKIPFSGGLLGLAREFHEVILEVERAVIEAEVALRPSAADYEAKVPQPVQVVPLLADATGSLYNIYQSLVYQKNTLLGQTNKIEVKEETPVKRADFIKGPVDIIFGVCLDMLENCLQEATAVSEYLSKTVSEVGEKQ